MDPISFTASLLTVLGAAQAGLTGLRKLNNYRNAPQEIGDLVSELEIVRSTLKDIKLFIEHHPKALYTESLIDCVNRAAAKIDTVNGLLDSTFIKIRGLSEANQSRIIWARYKHRLITLCDDLQVVRMDLSVRLGLVTASTSYKTGESLNVSIDANNKVTDQLMLVIEKYEKLNTAKGEQRTSDPSLTLVNSDSSDEARPASTDSDRNLLSACGGGDSDEGRRSSLLYVDEGRRRRSSSPSISPLISPRTSPAENSELERTGLYKQEALIDRVPNPMSKKCLPWCSCSCHARRSFNSPFLLRTFIGELNLQYRGKRPECNEHNCHRTANSSYTMKYNVPKYLMSRYVVMTMRYVPLDGPQFTLRMPRVMKWSHPLWNYAHENNVLAIQRLYSEGKASPHDVNPHGSSALIYAAGHSNLQMSQFLLQQSADPDLANDYGRTPAELLWERSFAGHLGPEDTCRVGIMLKDHDNVETWRFSTVHKIVLGLLYRDLRSELEVSTASINIGDTWGRTPLCWATIRNDSATVKTLLDFGADPNVRDESGHTPLHYVQTPEICKTLLDAGIDVHIRNSGLKSALHEFCRGHVRRSSDLSALEVIDLLIKAGVDVNVCDDKGEIPLMNAIHAGLLDHARRLLAHGADVNAFNYGWGGDASLHFAVRWNQPDIIPLLLEKGADYTQLNFSDRNVAHLAAQAGSAKTMAVLAVSRLIGLDVTKPDKDGKTPADYLQERTICTESEVGLHEEYAKWMRSLPPKKPTVSISKSWPLINVDDLDSLESQSPPEEWHVPGSYPDLRSEKGEIEAADY